MSQYLIIYGPDVYMVNAESYEYALDSLSDELGAPRGDLVLECKDLELQRRQREGEYPNLTKHKFVVV
jgi:hypothetical protein